MTNDPITVLLVDDDRDLLDLSKTFLEREANTEVLPENSARAGLDRLAEESIDCIVSDYQMPEMDGIEFLEAVRERHPELPFVLFTGKGSEEVASDAISAGVTDYLQKERGTAQYELLANRIENVVGLQRARTVTAETERRLGTIAEHSPDIVWEFTADWEELLFINPAYEEVSGRSVPELRAHPETFLESIHPEDRSGVRAAMERLSAGESIDIEYRMNAQEEYGRWVWTQGEPVFDEAGNVESVVGFVRDITERRERERDHETLLTQTEFVLEQTTSTIWSFDLEADAILTTIGSIDQLLGVDPAEVASLDAFFENGVHPEDRAKFERVTEDLMQGESTEFAVEFRTHPDTGEVRWIESTGYLSDTSDRGHLVGLSTDITERKRNEAEVTRQNNRLEKFAQLVSHDLRSPLSVAAGKIELATEEHPSEHLVAADAAVGRAQALIDDLLSLARNGRLVDETEPIDLCPFSEQCWPHVDTASARLVCDTSLTVHADRSRLKQVFENLYRNAVDHGGDSVTVTVGDRPGGSGFYIEDDGPGIPDGERETIFESGYSTVEGGTGLGLAIVGEIVAAHGWHISVTDGASGGARFVIATDRDAQRPTHLQVNAET